ncbi:tRNA-dihydrouridine(20a/20b) synthase [NAD(P)+]-like [Saccoglossus kowalevskii]|uniref:tRNA-dihydrouridine(20a/20b) synthase [NAD(P)+]-like isoform X1 n=1 Tax=Saccoglossus kowalevskii TaxID=10224 RepID=A0ABM0GXI1_SACKO|nr:PREDICTED: tRNA-dihydrouridine(20a/20b) synthase [NAD(P)+]-like isoform X1 [Saccoglossus kowalevskii]XP_006822457.1 PREDICTED: tRNA-dihydrouridine(20a/20b) synthase [NAD(P)+]-like isoform X2 [Saccoglossus kowalevskii]
MASFDDCNESSNTTMPCRPRVSVQEMLKNDKVLNISAPMVRYSKLAFRTLVRKYGCDVTFTPMIVSDSFIKSIKARDNEFSTHKGDQPLIVQFAANNTKDFVTATELIAPFADGVDLNCGCPQRWAMANGFGANLIKHPELVKDMVQQTRNKIQDEKFSVSIKIRLRHNLRDTLDLCQKAEHAGVSWITVHGRTTEQRTEPVNYEDIKIIKENLSIPVIANGDVKSLKDVNRVHELTKVDGVMAARGMLHNPAMYAGYEFTPLECIQDWVDISLQLGTQFQCFHHHLIQMMEHVTSKADKRIFNTLSNVPAVLDYLQEHYQVSYNPARFHHQLNKSQNMWKPEKINKHKPMLNVDDYNIGDTFISVV